MKFITSTKLVLALAVSLTTFAICAAQDDVDKLLAESNPAIQRQLQAISRTFRPGEGISNNVEALREIQKLKELTDDKAELVKQIAIFSVAPGAETQPMLAGAILHYLELPSRFTIRALAPYLNTKNPQLRSFVRDWFQGHDNADPGVWGAVNYKDYLDYVSWAVNRKEDVPAPFVKYIYERSPGWALLVFAYANSHGDVTARLQAIRKSIEGRKQTETKTGNDNAERQARLSHRREIELAEHIVSNAIWLNKNKFDERFQAALPEAMTELEKLAKHKEWWARLYVAYIMRQNPPLLRDNVLRQLSDDSNVLVSEAAKSNK
jgi:hypothetical protein